ncbi:hypothetical protein Q7P35_007583 [Cladosporium inversicolor]
MQIKVRTLTGKEIELDIEPDYKVQRIKERVEEKEGIPPPQQRLIYGGKQMADDKTAEEYALEGGATLHLVLALRGGSSTIGGDLRAERNRYAKGKHREFSSKGLAKRKTEKQAWRLDSTGQTFSSSSS